VEKIKHFLQSEKGKDALVVAIVILAGIASFELGRLSMDRPESGIKIEYTKNEAGASFGSLNEVNALSGAGDSGAYASEPLGLLGKTFFASNRGQKYYSIGCSAGKTIKQENRIYFATAAEAEQAGYEKSSSCK